MPRVSGKTLEISSYNTYTCDGDFLILGGEIKRKVHLFWQGNEEDADLPCLEVQRGLVL